MTNKELAELLLQYPECEVVTCYDHGCTWQITHHNVFEVRAEKRLYIYSGDSHTACYVDGQFNASRKA